MLAADLVGSTDSERNRGEYDDVPAGPSDDRLSKPLCDRLVELPVGEGRQIGAVLFQDATGMSTTVRDRSSAAIRSVLSSFR